MSRAERRRLPPPPRLGRVLRLAAEDLYYHGVRLVVANLIWGVGALMAAYAVTRSPVGLLTLVVMIPLTIGLMGMATALVRERNVVMSDFSRAIRAGSWRLLALGLVQLALLAIAAVDLLIGLQLGGPIGLVLAVVAFYTWATVWLLALTIWPIVLDPERSDEPIRSGLRLGAALALAHPIRIGLMAIALALLAVVATVLAAAIITFAAAYIVLVAAHFVLPAADRLEGRQTMIDEG